MIVFVLVAKSFEEGGYHHTALIILSGEVCEEDFIGISTNTVLNEGGV